MAVSRKRNGGCGIVFEQKLYLWGGCEYSDYSFDVFDFNKRTWSHQPTSGNFPSLSCEDTLGLGSSLVVHPESRSFYLYGGWNEGRFSSEVYRCSVDTWQWEIVELTTIVKPMPRYLAGMVVYNDRLCMFGGVGLLISDGYKDPGAVYDMASVKGVVQAFGWNNDYYEFDIHSRKYL